MPRSSPDPPGESPRPRRHNRGHAARAADAIYTLQMREHIIRRTAQGASDDEIASELGQTPQTIRRYKRTLLEEGPRALPPPPEEEPRHRARIPPKGPGPGPHRPRSPKRVEVLPGPDVLALRAACLSLRKAAQPFDVIGLRLGISTVEARRYTAEALREISDSETTNAELERRLMVEQIDDMIRAAYTMATRSAADPDGPGLPPNFDATDRIIKLLDRKSKLLGLDQVPAQDIKIKLQQLAVEGNYDLAELEDIAKQVLARHRFQILEPASVDDVS